MKRVIEVRGAMGNGRITYILGGEESNGISIKLGENTRVQ